MVGSVVWSVLVVASGGQALASEGGGTTYPIGVNNVLPGIMPRPGEYRYYDYSQSYSSDEFLNATGKSSVPNFRVRIYANAFRFLHTWAGMLGPFTVTSGFGVPISDIQLSAGNRKGYGFGIGDVQLQPVIVAWHNPKSTFFVNVAPNVYVPTGRYKASRLVNNGRNLVDFAPQLNATWLIGQRLEASVGNTFEVNTTNPDTHYHSGADYDLDYEITGVPISAFRRLHLGLNGYIYKQFEDDTLRGVPVAGGGRGQAVSFGPLVRLDLGRSAVVLKWDHEVNVRNRPSGERVWLQFTIPLSAQTRLTKPNAPPVEK